MSLRFNNALLMSFVALTCSAAAPALSQDAEAHYSNHYFIPLANPECAGKVCTFVAPEIEKDRMVDWINCLVITGANSSMLYGRIYLNETAEAIGYMAPTKQLLDVSNEVTVADFPHSFLVRAGKRISISFTANGTPGSGGACTIYGRQ